MKQRTGHTWLDSMAVYRHPRVIAMLFLGFSAGLPLLLVFGTLSAWLREAGIDRSTIGHVSWVATLYALKFAWYDGANSFDPLLIAKIARRAGLIPEELLGRIHISRAFTCHQMEALVVERLAGAFRRFGTNVAIVSGLLDTFPHEA